MIEIIDKVTLSNAARAIRICHDTIDKCDSTVTCIGEKDKDLIKRVGVKMKHASTLEHLRFTFKVTGDTSSDIRTTHKIISFFRHNKYSIYTNTKKGTYEYIISTNMRVLVENSDIFDTNELMMFVPEEYMYLLMEDK